MLYYITTNAAAHALLYPPQQSCKAQEIDLFF